MRATEVNSNVVVDSDGYDERINLNAPMEALDMKLNAWIIDQPRVRDSTSLKNILMGESASSKKETRAD